MDFKEKAEKALRSRFQVGHLGLRDDDGITGVMVSPDFGDLSSSGRQDLLDRAFREELTDRERRRITLISALTPVEYEAKLDLDRLG